MPEVITFSESLKTPSQPATAEEAPEIIARLETELAQHENGIGLSAIQIGIPKRIFIIAIAGKDGKTEKYEHFINPEIVEQDEEFTFQGEGCLSYPGIYLNTKRYRHFTMKRGVIKNCKYEEEELYFYYNPEEDGRNSNLISIAVQHEYDHLSGKVLIEYGEENKGTPMERPKGKIGRNEKCPCQSGKKFKNCCMGKNR